MLRWSVVAAVGWAVAAMAVTPVAGSTPAYTQVTVNNGAGSSFDPHVSGDIAAYTHDNKDGLGNAIHFYRFSTGVDSAIPHANGEQDLLSDTDGNLVVYSHVSGLTTSIRVFDTNTMVATEIDPAPGVSRFDGSLGGGQLAYIDTTLEANGELVLHDMATNVSTRLTNDTAADLNPSVSPDGSTVVWEHCELDTNHCDVWQGVRSGATWTVSVASADPSNETFPDTNGSLITYSADRPAGAGDVFYRAVGGSVETELDVTGVQSAPALAGNFIAFASNAGGNYDVYLYDVMTNTLYQVTNTSFDELLDDATILADGSVRLIWENTELSASQTHVYAATISFPVACTTGCGTGGGAGGGAGGGQGSGMGGSNGGGSGGGGGGDDCDDDDDDDGHHHGDGDGHGDDGGGCNWGGHGWHHNEGGWHFHHHGHEEHHHGWGWGHHGGGGHCGDGHGNGHHWTGHHDGDGDHQEHHDDLSASTDSNGARGCSTGGGAPWLVLVALVLIALGSRKPQAQPVKAKK